MSLEQFVPFLPEIFLACAGFVVLLLGIPMGRQGVRRLSLIGAGSLRAMRGPRPLGDLFDRFRPPPTR